ncbi:MAG: hypothetical protein JWL69_5135 [Phycisphaerales bacterium]|nr:hypothetical protein [Phycisphaerales bacterium]MDB5356695.1 hypothetical protein [Phycisphaerales bacterium]
MAAKSGKLNAKYKSQNEGRRIALADVLGQTPKMGGPFTNVQAAC